MHRLGLALLLLSITFVGSSAQDADNQTLQISVLPVLNTMPLFVAQSEGLYEEAGVTVELIPFNSARDRQIAPQTGNVDGANTDMVGVVLLSIAGSDIKIVRHDAFTEQFRYFSVIANADSGITTADELIAALQDNSAQLATASNTIIEYLTTTMLRAAGYEPQRDDYLEISAIPVRLEQLAAGTVAAATLPEPLTTLASNVQGGAVILSDNDATDFIPTVIAFRQQTLNEKPEAVRAFLAAYEEAVELINDDPEAYRDTPVQVPDPVRETYTIPQFVTARVPSEEQTQAVVDWMRDQDLIDAQVDYIDIVDASFLPETEPEPEPEPAATEAATDD